ncbi:IS3 family transposase, partial [uncultured Vibrio sp.]|uniref:IS3 family transposase n=1 Tax=uncultured Vibrio sp. TaxID=114054 RepID=UPI00262F4E21
MKQDVTNYVRYYNLDRLHSANQDLSAIEFENSLKKCPVGLDQYRETMYRCYNLGRF